MGTEERQLSEKESLDLIATMINKAKNAYYDTGVTAIMWGAVIALCSLEKLAELQFGYRLPFDIFMLIFVAIIPQVFISIKEKKSRTVKSYDDPYMDYIWLAFGICILLLLVIVNVIYNVWGPVITDYVKLTRKSSPPFHEFSTPLFLMLYGLPTFITGAACKFRPMLWGGIFCWVCCIITLFTNIKIDLLLMAASAVMAWLYPGIIIEREYRNYKKEQVQVNV